MKNGRFGLLKSKFCVLQKPLQNYNENLGKSLRYEIRNSYKDITQIKKKQKKMARICMISKAKLRIMKGTNTKNS